MVLLEVSPIGIRGVHGHRLVLAQYPPGSPPPEDFVSEQNPWQKMGAAFGSGNKIDTPPLGGCCTATWVAVGLPPKTGGLWDSRSYTATLVSAR